MCCVRLSICSAPTTSRALVKFLSPWQDKTVMTQAHISLAQKASRLLELHHAQAPLVLINAWDAASAAVIAHCGLPAIATSSAAVANALGHADGQNLPWSEMLVAIERIARVVDVP